MPDEEKLETPRVAITYDKIDKSFSIQNLDTEELLWARSITLAQQQLGLMGYTPSQAREGALRAVFNDGNAIRMKDIEKIATLVDDENFEGPVSPKKLASRVYALADFIGSKDSVSGDQFNSISSFIREMESCLL